MSEPTMNLRVLDRAVGPWRRGDVVPVRAVEGGYPECDRLVACGACAWADSAPTVSPPAAASAVAEMGDDELRRENARLKARLEELLSGANIEGYVETPGGAVREVAPRAEHDALKAERDELARTADILRSERDEAVAAAVTLQAERDEPRATVGELPAATPDDQAAAGGRKKKGG